MRAWMIIVVLGAGFSVLGRAAPISRCEYADGRIVYSDEPCPDGSQRVRTVNEKPAVEVIRSKEDRAQSAKSSGSVRRSGDAEASDNSPEAAAELRKMKVAECDDLVRRIEYAQHDLSAAPESERASAELSLRRLQAEHEGKCTPKH
ncbi:MAG TPA: DUF4124 domain-containing protein [Burkholderiaceae bacterium]|nr:DUF4124 domain-containing protein [Burkholderiaceae bacterium]